MAFKPGDEVYHIDYKGKYTVSRVTSRGQLVFVGYEPYEFSSTRYQLIEEPALTVADMKVGDTFTIEYTMSSKAEGGCYAMSSGADFPQTLGSCRVVGNVVRKPEPPYVPKVGDAGIDLDHNTKVIITAVGDTRLLVVPTISSGTEHSLLKERFQVERASPCRS